MLKQGMILCMGMGLLTGCTSTSAPAYVPPPSPELICLPLKTYSLAQQKQAVTEIQEYGQYIPQMVNMLEDYGVMREEDKECLMSPPIPTDKDPNAPGTK